MSKETRPIIPVRITFSDSDSKVAEAHIFGEEIFIEAKGFTIPCAITKYRGGRDFDFADERYFVDSERYAVTDLRSGGVISNTNKINGHDTPEGAIAQATLNASVVDEATYEIKYEAYLRNYPMEGRKTFVISPDGKHLILKPAEAVAVGEPIETVDAILFNLI